MSYHSQLMYGLYYQSAIMPYFVSVIPPGEGGASDNILTEDGTEIETEGSIEIYGEG